MGRKRALRAVAAVEENLKLLARRDPQLARSPLAASLLALARELDAPGNSATSRAMCAKAYSDTFEQLWALAPEDEEADRLDDLSARRAARLAGGASS